MRWRRGYKSPSRFTKVIGITDEGAEVKTFTFRSDAQTWFATCRVGSSPSNCRYPTETDHVHLHAVDVAVAAVFHLGHGQFGADSIGTRWMFDNLWASARALQGLWAGRRFLASHPPERQISVPVGGVGHHADDVDAALVQRLRAGH